MEEIFNWGALASLLSLTVMEIVLGIDNVIFISIVSGKLNKEDQKRARFIGLLLALVIRIGLLFTITWLKKQEEPLFTLYGYSLSVRDLILITGGLFLTYNSIKEVHNKLEGDEHVKSDGKKTTFSSAVLQIVALDVVFSFDSILTAVGIADKIWVMIAAVILSLGVMLAFSGSIADFVNKHPSIKMLALSFLIMIGLLLVAEGLPKQLQLHVPKGYIYFAMAFSFGVEMLNLRAKKKSTAVKLKNPKMDELIDLPKEDENR